MLSNLLISFLPPLAISSALQFAVDSLCAVVPVALDVFTQVSTRQGGAEIALTAARSGKGAKRHLASVSFTDRLNRPLEEPAEGSSLCMVRPPLLSVAARKDLAGGLDPTHIGHGQIHEHHVGRHAFTASMADVQSPLPTTRTQLWSPARPGGVDKNRVVVNQEDSQLRIGKATSEDRCPGR